MGGRQQTAEAEETDVITDTLKSPKKPESMEVDHLSRERYSLPTEIGKGYESI